jgi:peptidoglycan-associated lipoprotein
MNSPIKKGSALLLVMLLSVAGCGKKRKCMQSCEQSKEISEIAMPVNQSSEDVKSKFDDDISEFALVDETPNDTKKTDIKSEEIAEEEDLNNEFSWIDEEDVRDESLKTVYFDFDKYSIRADQEASVCQDIDTLKKKISEAEKTGSKMTVVVEGNACNSSGSAAYNMALSEKRAKILADRLVGSGIPRTQVKVVGRGQEYPAMVNGKPVTGTREEQWLNRRDEINIINA